MTATVTYLHAPKESEAENEARWANIAENIRHAASPKNSIDIIDVPLLNEKVSEHYAEVVKRLRPHWISRGDGTFYTIGASTYNDLVISDGHASYYQVAEENNIIIAKHFTPLLDLVYKAIEKCFNHKVVELPMAGLTGFHIFGENADKHPDGGHIHTDEPFQRILWPEPFANPFSYTLALELPDGKGGLDYWENGATQRTYLPYEIGHLYIHDGRFPHRIASDHMPSKEKPRITLQGHGALLLDTNTIGVYF